jgi:DNA replication protein DnaC
MPVTTSRTTPRHDPSPAHPRHADEGRDEPMTILRPALADSLRTLKLSRMLETLDARLAQAQGGDLGYLEFLQILCDDEITRREQVAMGRRLRRARFDTETTLEGFDFSANSKLPAAQIRDLAALRWLQAGESIILYGAVCVGKTHVAQTMGHLAIRAGAEVRFHKTSRILADLAGGHADRTFDKRLAAHVKGDLLILDDFAMREFSPGQADDLYELISQRIAEGRSIAITANRAPQDWYPLFPNPVVAESLLDRLINNSHQVLHERPLLPAEQTAQGLGRYRVDDSIKTSKPRFATRSTPAASPGRRPACTRRDRSMTTHITGDPAIPDPEERAARNVALFADNIETGFWDDQGRVAPWPDDIDEWTPGTNEPRTPDPGQPPF